MNLNGSRKIGAWDENALLVETVKALGNGVPVRTSFPSALSEWLDGCPLDRETLWAGLHASWNGLGTESEPTQLPFFLAPKSFQYLRPLLYTSDSTGVCVISTFWARAYLEAWHWVHPLICLWFSEVSESPYWDYP